MRKSAARLALALLLMALTASVALAQSNATKTLQGKVFGSNDAPLSGAIVYLQDGKTNGIRSFFSTSDGSYRFGPLSSDTDYQVWAQYKNAKSATKTISSYDSRPRVVIDLHIKTRK
ncbi:MAG: carboxypeptidase-like regulatory domain-containing protein [Silvibacterium sp.]